MSKTKKKSQSKHKNNYKQKETLKYKSTKGGMSHDNLKKNVNIAAEILLNKNNPFSTPEPVAEPGVAVAQELVKPLTPPQILDQLLVFIVKRRDFFYVFTEVEEETINLASKMRIDESMSKSMINKRSKSMSEFIYKLFDIIFKRLNFNKLSIDTITFSSLGDSIINFFSNISLAPFNLVVKTAF